MYCDDFEYIITTVRYAAVTMSVFLDAQAKISLDGFNINMLRREVVPQLTPHLVRILSVELTDGTVEATVENPYVASVVVICHQVVLHE